MKSPAPPVLLALALLWSGCGSSETVRKDAGPPDDDFGDYVARNESDFHPEEFGVETWNDEHVGHEGAVTGGPEDTPRGAEPDTVPGFRVQVSITQEIDFANELRDSLAARFPGEWVYVVYHPPYYKVRLGNYPERYDAGAMLDRLRNDGYPDAWIVPDKILRHIPPPGLPEPDPREDTIPDRNGPRR